MEAVLAWTGAITAIAGLIWLMRKFTRPITNQREPFMQYDGYVSPQRFMLVIDELDEPTVMGYFANTEDAHLRAHKHITGEEFITSSKWPLVADWFLATPGVHVTKLVTT